MARIESSGSTSPSTDARVERVERVQVAINSAGAVAANRNDEADLPRALDVAHDTLEY